jgi:hypothetical protein
MDDMQLAVGRRFGKWLPSNEPEPDADKPALPAARH